jgi:Tfp pilus assembly protein PilN
MVRINLLPAEVLERRKYERFYPYIFIGGAIVLAVIAIIWVGAQFMIASKTAALQDVEETEAKLNRQAESLAIFEQQQDALKQRELVAFKALSGRVNIGKIMEEISLVLPVEVWVDSLSLSQDDGMQMGALTHDRVKPDLNEGYKSVAATLVRLGSLTSLADVWLTSAEASDEFSEFQGADSGGAAPAMPFECSARIVVPAVPAPPIQAGQ